MTEDGDIDAGLLAIALSDTEEEEEDDAAAATADGTSSAAPRDRTGQTEEAFRVVRASYRAKLENGEIWKNVKIPSGQRRVSKHEGQEILHAVEELYFYRRYDEAVSFIGRVLQGEEGGGGGGGGGGGTGPEGLDGDVRALLAVYETRCRERLAGQQSAT